MTDAERQRTTLRRVAADDPELAARLILMTLPAAAARIPGTLAFDLELDGLGAWRVSVSDGRARVDPVAGQAETDFRLAADPRSFVELVTGDAHPLGQLLRGGCAWRASRRRALRLRAMSEAEPDLGELVRSAGGSIPTSCTGRCPTSSSRSGRAGTASSSVTRSPVRAGVPGTSPFATASRCA